MFIQFQTDDIVPNQQETVTRAMFSNNVGNLTTFFSSSAQTATQKTYYYEVFNSASTAPTAEAQFSVAFGHRFGSGSEGEGGQVDDTPSRAIYSQYRQLCLDAGVRSFTNNGVNSDYIYVINFNRARLKDGIDEGNIELNLHHLSGSEFINGVGYNAAHTGSNVQLGASTAIHNGWPFHHTGSLTNSWRPLSTRATVPPRVSTCTSAWSTTNATASPSGDTTGDDNVRPSSGRTNTWGSRPSTGMAHNSPVAATHNTAEPSRSHSRLPPPKPRPPRMGHGDRRRSGPPATGISTRWVSPASAAQTATTLPSGLRRGSVRSRPARQS